MAGQEVRLVYRGDGRGDTKRTSVVIGARLLSLRHIGLSA